MQYNPAMQIPDDALDAFIKIYKKEFKQKISREEAREMATNLLTLYRLLSRPLPTRCGASGEEDRPRA